MRVREALEKEKERDKVKLKQLDRELDKMKEELQVTITDHIGNYEYLMLINKSKRSHPFFILFCEIHFRSRNQILIQILLFNSGSFT